MKKALFFILLLLPLFSPQTATAKDVIIQTTGMAVGVPGDFGVQFFYLANGRNLWQIYSYRKTFPTIKKGDILRIQGIKSETKGLPRIKIKEQKQVIVLSHQFLPASLKINISQAKENSGKIVLLSGEIRVTESGYFLTDKTGEIELLSGGKSNTLKGQAKNITISGIPATNSEKTILLVLSSNSQKSPDIKIKTEASPDLIRPQKETIFLKNLLIIVLLGLLSLITIRIIRKRRNF